MKSTTIAIVGAGFAGICMGIRLKRAGIDDFVICDEGEDIGGTWRDNRYPGAACDVPSHLYSFSFEPNPEWTRAYANQKEIQAYLVHCVDKFRLRPHLRLGTKVRSATFVERTGTYALETDPGGPLDARVLVTACGGLSRPCLPDIAGLDGFEGTAMHSARWNPGLSLEGKTVAIIGTGASAIQIVPAIAPHVARLYVFQRTPPWILPKPDGPISRWKRRAFKRMPLLQRLARAAIYWRAELLATAFVYRPGLLTIGERVAKRYLRRSVTDPSLRAKLVPSYAMGCKRILPSNDYYPALQRPNVDLVVEGIDTVRRHSIVTLDGKERPVDIIVLATGFRAAEQVAPFEIAGRDGLRLDEVWRQGAEAYLGTTIHGFPNFFMLVGPNTGLGHSSLVFMIESQVHYVLGMIRRMQASHLRSVEVRRDEQVRYNGDLASRLRKTVWASGCSSWYLTRDGKNTTLWPGFTFEFWLRTRRFDAQRYELQSESAANPGPAEGE
jgi:cation diffusion facilitator CzcD-associated flavoprotein CzcO